MGNVEQISDQVKSLYLSNEDAGSIDMPDFIALYGWISKTNDYSKAASLLSDNWPEFTKPYIQVMGQAIELALKTYLVASDERATFTHDLILLVKKCDSAGFSFEDREIALISHLHHHYYQDFNTGTKFKSRYPATNESNGGSYGLYADYEKTIVKLVELSEEILKNKEAEYAASRGNT